MSNQTTDSTNVIENQNSESITPEQSDSIKTVEKPSYEVVFFARYNKDKRPSSEDITNFFNKYGVVHHVKCPESRNCAFIFMTSLNTTAEHRRTRTTISQIIHDMTPENQFHITVADGRRPRQYHNNNNQFNKNYSLNNFRNNNFRNNFRNNNFRNNDSRNNDSRFFNNSNPFNRNTFTVNRFNNNKSFTRPFNNTHQPRFRQDNMPFNCEITGRLMSYNRGFINHPIECRCYPGFQCSFCRNNKNQ
uniref:RRM domain-containing protein n=1 Tax=Borely moumouvirus TaxID=2712067 RepID=A0A6G6ACX5_9VIRU